MTVLLRSLAGALLLLALAGPALAQSALPGAPHSDSAATPAISSSDAQAVLDILNDPKKRAAFAATLEKFVHAQNAVAPPPQTPVPLAPNSVGAQIIKQSAGWFAGLSRQAAGTNKLLGDLPAVWAFSVRTLSNPDSRAEALNAGWHLGLIVLIAAAVEWGFRRLLRGPIAALARHAPGGDGQSETEKAPAEGSHLRARRFARSLKLLLRIPFALLRLLLEAMPPAVFLGLCYAGLMFTDFDAQAVLWVAVTSYVAGRAVIVVTRAIVSPQYPTLRLVHLSDERAQYVVVWMRRLVAVVAFAYAAGQIGIEFGLSAQARDAFVRAVMLIDHIFVVIIILQNRKSVAAWIRGKACGSFTSTVRGRLASIWHLVAIFFAVALWVVWASRLHNGYLRLWHFFLVSAAVLIAARLISLLLLSGLDRAFRFHPETSARHPGLEERANRYYPILRSTLSTVLVVATCMALLQAWGVNTLSWFKGAALGKQLFSAMGTTIVTGLVALAVWEGANASLEQQVARLTREAQMVKSARLRTLMPILRTVLMLTLFAVFGLTALSEIGVNIAPLLAGAGILGVAIGFGSQKLVQDFITGIFLLLENAMQVGDWVTVAGLSGSVEDLSIRTMRLRAGDGSVHIVPFSSVGTVTNVNRGIGNAAVSVNIPIEEDSDHVSDVLGEIARKMRSERRFADMMRSDFQLWGVDKVDAGVITIVGQIVCTDSGRWAVQREFNRRMNIRFKELGIRIATPVTTVLNRDVTEPKPKLSDASALPMNQVRESPPPAALGNQS